MGVCMEKLQLSQDFQLYQLQLYTLVQLLLILDFAEKDVKEMLLYHRKIKFLI